MRIGITVNLQYSFFSAGLPQTALGIGEVLRLRGHTVFLLNTGVSAAWWDDCKEMAEQWEVVQAKDKWTADLVLEVGSHVLPSAVRNSSSIHIWVCRKAPLFHDIEASLYPFLQNPKRDLDCVKEIWVLDELVGADDIQYLEILTKKPVRSVPFVWTPTAIEIHRKETQSPVWAQMAALPEVQGKPWSPHICETHTSSSSSCTIPLFIYRQLRQKCPTISFTPTLKIHNAENVRRSQFFQKNVLAHFTDPAVSRGSTDMSSRTLDLSGEFMGRQRCIDWCFDPKSICLAHMRYITLRPYLLDLAWVGVPFIHNAPLLKELGGIVSKGYYEDNSITQGAEALQRVISEASTNLDELMEIRKKVLDRFSPLSQRIQEKYMAAITDCVKGGSSDDPKPTSLTQTPIRVGFSDMWDQFNIEYNPFLLMMEAAYKGRRVLGIDISRQVPGEEEIDLLVFGPFGQRWRQVKKGVPTVHYTGENTEPVKEANLNLGFGHFDAVGEEYMRLPLWMLEINWFGADVDRLANPKPVPVSRCMDVYPEELAEKKKFCCFIVTNPKQPMRNKAFEWLNTYKRVDSAGRLFNNIGPDIFAGLGGGGGELAKVSFMRQYKFALVFENESADGYVTEKLLHAKAAGCIPIYWGDPKVERDFNVEGCIDARAVKTRDELVELVRKVDENKSLWMKKFSVPALTEVARDKVRVTLAECARRLWKLAGVKEEVLNEMPKMIGALNDSGILPVAAPAQASTPAPTPAPAPAQASAKEQVATASLASSSTNPEICLVTAANSKFLPSLQLWLQSATAQQKAGIPLKALVYLMDDVSKDVEEQYKENFPIAEYRRFPSSETPVDFPDIWSPEHFAWKIFIYQELVKEESLRGKLIFYTDSGIFMCRWPREWLDCVKEKGFCVLEDKGQENERWCHAVFKRGLKMTEEEGKSQQIVAGIMGFISGDEKALAVFSEAWQLAQKRDLIVGVKWEGLGKDGKPFGHRHDQSILSLLTQRAGVARWPLYNGIYCDVSLRHTFLSRAALYVHRGNFRVHVPVLEGIDDAWIINLDRRSDRLEKFKGGHKDLAERILRMPAFDGLKLSLTPSLARLFAPHDFGWKKSVMGCALSHLAVWMHLLTDKPEIKSYLVLEDDARLDPEWRSKWEEAVEKKEVPEDWDVIYLGGILPPNRAAFEGEAVEHVNDTFAKVRQNSIFGQKPANRYFHFCAYAYLLSRRGAAKILEVLKAKGGYWTSADHMICNIYEVLNIYFFHPLVAGCYQDDDPVYQKSQFNDFDRKDVFDSDLWNNTERFSEAEVAKALGESQNSSLDIMKALEDARGKVDVAATATVTATATATATATKAPEQASSPLPKAGPRRLMTVAGPPLNTNKLYEYSWLKQILHENAGICMEAEVADEPQDDQPIVILQRPYVEEAVEALGQWRKEGKSFFLLHLSDEHGKDPIDIYSWPECLGVIRNYVRHGLEENQKVRIIPLGFHWAIENGEPFFHTPQTPFRELTWSFVGTKWAGRDKKLSVLEEIGKRASTGSHKLVLFDDWAPEDGYGRKEMLGVLLNSWFVPCPSGNNAETFRIYEALEAGALPVFVKEEGMEPLFKMLAKWMPLLVTESWGAAAGLIHTLRAKPEVYEQYRIQILSGWERCKKDVRAAVLEVFQVPAKAAKA